MLNRAGNKTDKVHTVPESRPQIFANLSVIFGFLLLNDMITDHHPRFEF